MAQRGRPTTAAAKGTGPPQKYDAIPGTESAGGIPPVCRTVTYDSNPIDHWITDAELIELTELRKDYVVEIFWGVLGAFLGSVVPTVQLLPKIGNTADPLGGTDVFVMLMSGTSFGLTVIMAFFWVMRAGKTENLTKKIRERKKFLIPMVADE